MYVQIQKIYINFNDKNLRELDKNLFSGCKEALKAINFENNEIGDFSPVLFLRFKNLESIKFKNTKLKELKKDFKKRIQWL